MPTVICYKIVVSVEGVGNIDCFSDFLFASAKLAYHDILGTWDRTPGYRLFCFVDGICPIDFQTAFYELNRDELFVFSLENEGPMVHKPASNRALRKDYSLDLHVGDVLDLVLVV